MSDCFIVRHGGVQKIFATINVIYPVGATCTCSNGTKTFTSENTDGKWIFSIPATGTWTVTVTGSTTQSAAVLISSQYQSVTVDLSSTGLVIYNLGFIPLGSTTQTTETNGTVNLAESKIEFTHTANKNAEPRVTFYPIDLTNWSALKANFHGAIGGNNIYPAVFVADAADASVWASTYSKINLSSGADGTVSLDITEVTGIHYVGVASTTDNGIWVAARTGQYCSKVWLE